LAEIRGRKRAVAGRNGPPRGGRDTWRFGIWLEVFLAARRWREGDWYRGEERRYDIYIYREREGRRSKGGCYKLSDAACV